MTLSLDIRHQRDAFTLDVQVQAPEGVTALFGRSGAGKTSVVNAVAGLLRPQSGQISVNGHSLFDSAKGIDLPTHKRGLGYVFQDARLFPHLSVRANLTYGTRFAQSRPGPSTEDVCTLLDITPLLNRRPATLSGGEQQRVAIGRALLARPRLLLLDEPLAALDTHRKTEILPYLERLRDQLGLPMLYVSHSVAEIARLATTVIVLDQGRVVQAGAAETVLSDPQMVRQLGVRQAGALVPAHVIQHHADGLSELEISAGRLFLPRMDLPAGARTRVRILAQDVMLATQPPQGLSALNILPATVLSLKPGEGPGVICQLRFGQDLLLARITRRSAQALDLQPGRQVFAVIKSVSVDPVDVGRG